MAFLEASHFLFLSRNMGHDARGIPALFFDLPDFLGQLIPFCLKLLKPGHGITMTRVHIDYDLRLRLKPPAFQAGIERFRIVTYPLEIMHGITADPSLLEPERVIRNREHSV